MERLFSRSTYRDRPLMFQEARRPALRGSRKRCRRCNRILRDKRSLRQGRRPVPGAGESVPTGNQFCRMALAFNPRDGYEDTGSTEG